MEESEVASRRTDNVMAKRKRTKEQTTIEPHYKLDVNSGAPDG